VRAVCKSVNVTHKTRNVETSNQYAAAAGKQSVAAALLTREELLIWSHHQAARKVSIHTTQYFRKRH